MKYRIKISHCEDPPYSYGEIFLKDTDEEAIKYFEQKYSNENGYGYCSVILEKIIQEEIAESISFKK